MALYPPVEQRVGGSGGVIVPPQLLWGLLWGGWPRAP